MKKKNITITLGNKTFYLLSGFFIIILIAGIAAAIQNWEVHGHSPDEIGKGDKSVQVRLCALEEKVFGTKDASCSPAQRECTTDTDCKDPAKPKCDTTAGICVAVGSGCIYETTGDKKDQTGAYNKAVPLPAGNCAGKGCNITISIFGGNNPTIPDKIIASTFIQQNASAGKNANKWTSAVEGKTLKGTNGKAGGQKIIASQRLTSRGYVRVKDDCTEDNKDPTKICLMDDGEKGWGTISICPAI